MEDISILGLKAYGDELHKVTNQLTTLTKRTGEAAKAIEGFAAQAVKAGAKLTATEKSMKETEKIVSSMKKAVTDVTNAMVQATGVPPRLAKAFSSVAEVLLQVKSAAGGGGAALSGFVAALPLAALNMAGAALYALWDKMKEGEREAKKLAEGFDEAAEKAGLLVATSKEFARLKFEKSMEAAEKAAKEAGRIFEAEASRVNVQIWKMVAHRDIKGDDGVTPVFDSAYISNMQKAIDTLEKYKKTVADADGDYTKINSAFKIFLTTIQGTHYSIESFPEF
jgi:hypothetical protein